MQSSSSSRVPTFEPNHRWWLELDMEESNGQNEGNEKDEEEEEEEMDYYAIMENARAEQQAKKTDIYYGLFGDSSSYITLKSQQKIGLFGRFF
jgi:alkaline phosphatase